MIPEADKTGAAFPRPNVVLIVADDMGFSDIGCFGGEICTPGIDRLAREGMRFTSFYNNAVCMPTRASLLTGLYPQQVGAAERAELAPAGNLTLAEALQAAGYRTMMAGKWHNGSAEGRLPWQRGFQRYRGLLSGSSNYFNPGLPRPGEPAPAHKQPGQTRPWGIDGRVVHPFTPEDPCFYSTDAFTEWALEFLDSHPRDGTPFFLYLAYCAPHFPMQAPREDIERYRGGYLRGWDEIRQERFERLRGAGLADGSWTLSPRDGRAPAWEEAADRDLWDLKMSIYAAMVDRMDQGIRRVMDKVREMGVEQDTLFLFLSDNGGCAQHIDASPGVVPGGVDSYCTVDAPWANASNTPFRRFKVFTHEGGICTPLVARWPRVIPAGTVNRSTGHVMDLMPTLMEICGAAYPGETSGGPLPPPEGISLLPAFRGELIRERPPVCWEFRGCRAVRDGEWKLVTQGPARESTGIVFEQGFECWELYNLEEDRCETRNLAGKEPGRVRRLERLWLEWRSRMSGPEEGPGGT